ncbi:hypothetical protein Pmar_PMAR028317 [Perkinsus marinus ATCC 50983]|nr:hypothetical protein Pmar_PMAR028317 [Perkinsus marinus ATCC 50983]EER01865.1 hypothetical protein Pmar_PMAR028317 [Perkinsus marinus ATCC 50983]|eukprot:XP_002769147.1 hypothetical protein Pmar_PMAR028317 [Perkinsus marinus ATCC 50983]
MQDDGRCLESSNNFTYVDMWNVESVEPTQGIFQNVHDSAALLVTGNNFYMHSDAV